VHDADTITADTITYVHENGKIAADHTDGQTTIATQTGQQVEDLGLAGGLAGSIATSSTKQVLLPHAVKVSAPQHQLNGTCNTMGLHDS
jgi:hypothetical protein